MDMDGTSGMNLSIRGEGMTVTEFFKSGSKDQITFNRNFYCANEEEKLVNDYAEYSDENVEDSGIYIAVEMKKPEITKDSLIDILEENDYETDESHAYEFLDIGTDELDMINSIFHSFLQGIYECGNKLEIDEEFMKLVKDRKYEIRG